jgi:hypothetical protein
VTIATLPVSAATGLTLFLVNGLDRSDDTGLGLAAFG